MRLLTVVRLRELVVVETIVGIVLAAEGATGWVAGNSCDESRVRDWRVVRGVEVEARLGAMWVLLATTKPDQERRGDGYDEGCHGCSDYDGDYTWFFRDVCAACC